MIFLLKPVEQSVNRLPVIGDAVNLPLPELAKDRSLLVFVRHTGCPFAERDIKESRRWATAHPDVRVVVVTHGDVTVRDRWLELIDGSDGVELYHDTDREFYGQMGLGYSSGWHFMGPKSLSGVVRLWFRGIFNRVASGTRWQRAGVFLLDDGALVWSHIPESAEGFRLPPESVVENQESEVR